MRAEILHLRTLAIMVADAKALVAIDLMIADLKRRIAGSTQADH
jgi:hypothetical protein